MKLHIDTAPVWEAYRQDCECPLCLLYDQVETGSVEYFLGDSVMEPSQRIEVNEKGFCGHHFSLMFEAGNRLGLALMTHTHMKQVIAKLSGDTKEVEGTSVFKRILGKKSADAPLQIGETCVMCERIRNNMERYIYTILYMYKHEKDFPSLLEKSKGMCLKHYEETMREAPNHLSGEVLQDFTKTLRNVELANLQRVADDLEWFTRKFDYRNSDKPWGNSRDAVERSINKLRGHVVN